MPFDFCKCGCRDCRRGDHCAMPDCRNVEGGPDPNQACLPCLQGRHADCDGRHVTKSLQCRCPHRYQKVTDER